MTTDKDISEITDKEISEEVKQERLQADAYLKGIVDFIKWSSTIAVAAILWIGNFITSTVGASRIVSACSLLLLMSSLIVAILAARNVLTAWAKGWDVSRAFIDFLLFHKYGKLTYKDRAKLIAESRNIADWRKKMSELDNLEFERTLKLRITVDEMMPFKGSKKFNHWVSLHIALLIGGLFTYIIAQFLSM